MTLNLHALLLIGSAKQTASTSEALGSYLVERLRDLGAASETLSLHRSILTSEQQEVFLSALTWADLVILSFPLYMDSPPYLVVRALELIAAHRPQRLSFKTQRLCCIVNCDLPEAHHNDTAIAICRRFAAENHFEWAGGLALGEASIVDGQPLTQLGRRAQPLTHALDLTAEALAAARPVPEQARELMGKPLVRPWMYTMGLNRSWKRIAKQYGAENKLNDKPHTE
ncbi:MAG: hypothetical protein WCF84_15600 [Anaerolineae bacterium]